MKTTNFILTPNNIKSTKYSFNLTNNKVSSFKSRLLNNAMKAYPFLKLKEPTIVEDIYIPKNDLFNPLDNNLLSEFEIAMDALEKYSRRTKKYDYDYVTELGEPVQIYKDFIQVGYTIIPRNNISPSFFMSLKPAERKTIIEITIKIKNLGIF